MSENLFSSLYFLRNANGRREISFLTWILVWIAPVLYALAAVWMLGYELYRHVASVPVEAEVVQVYAWEGTSPFDRGVTNYSPVYVYTDNTGREARATAGMSHADWNFALGSHHQIRYIPGAHADVIRPGWHNWLPGLLVGLVGVLTLIPALIARYYLLRWQRRGTEA